MSRVMMIVGALSLLGLFVAPGALADRREPASMLSTESDGTNFDVYTRDQLERHEPRGRKPAGWVGPWPPRSSEESTPEPAPGGGDTPLPADPGVIFTDVAVPPPGVEIAKAGTPARAFTEGAEHAIAEPEAPAPAQPSRKGKTRINTRGPDLRRASYESGTASLVDLREAHGRFTWSSATEREPVPLYTRTGFVTLIEFKNGERPSGGAFCGSCARVTQDGQVSEEGAFIVEAMADKVSIRPREASNGEQGLLATNLHIVTDSGRTLTFDVIEVTGTGLQPTARHEVRGSRDEGSTIVDYSFPERVAEAGRILEDRYRKDLSEREKGIVADKASQRMDTYTDVEVEKKASGRKLQIEAATTLGDETVIRMRVEAAPGDVGDPVALLQTGKRVRILRTRSVLRQPESSTLVITLSIEAVVLGEDQRITVSMLDKRSGEELRTSVGRG